MTEKKLLAKRIIELRQRAEDKEMHVDARVQKTSEGDDTVRQARHAFVLGDDETCSDSSDDEAGEKLQKIREQDARVKAFLNSQGR